MVLSVNFHLFHAFMITCSLRVVVALYLFIIILHEESKFITQFVVLYYDLSIF